MKTDKPKILIITGPTATGKSDIAVGLAKKFNGEIISADSRQVYRDLDIGTGKITKSEMKNIPHYLLDVVQPKKVFNVNEFTTLGRKAIKKILKKNKLPIICGGTGHYIDVLVNDVSLPDVEPNIKLRKKLEKKSADELFKMLIKLDPNRALTIDRKNKRRLIRAIEIVRVLGTVPKQKSNSPYSPLFIALTPKNLDKKISIRLKKRLKQGMINEARNLHKRGLSYKRMEELGLEYRYMARLLQNKISRKEFEEQLEREIKRYAKRQMTWFKKDKRIKWVNPSENEKIVCLVKDFTCGSTRT